MSAPCFAVVVVQKSPDDDNVRHQLEAEAAALGLEVPATARFPTIEVKDARQLAALSGLMHARRYRFEVLPWKGFLDLLCAWVLESRAMKKELRGKGLVLLTAAQTARLHRLVKDTRRSALGRQSLLIADWSPRLMNALQVREVRRLRGNDDDLITCLRVARALEQPVAVRVRAFEQNARVVGPERSARVELSGVPTLEVQRCALRCIAQLRARKPVTLAEPHRAWANWCQHFPPALAAPIMAALSAQFVAVLESGPPRFFASRVKAWETALWGDDHQGGRFLKRHIAAALRTRGHTDAARLAAEPSPY